MTLSPKILVLDGYAKPGREDLAANGCTVAGDLYVKMLRGILPSARCEIVCPADADAELPKGTALRDYDGIAWTGSSLTVYEDVPEVRRQVEFAKAAFEAQIPSFGSCWAAQIAVVAAGGIVRANPLGREMGIARKISLSPEGRGHPMYAGKSSVFYAFISHVDEVTHLPSGAVSLAGNTFTKIQALSVSHAGGQFWAVQYHPEYNLHEMARLTSARTEKLIKLGFFKDRDAVSAYVNLLESLHQDPSRRDIAWLLGIDDDVMKEDMRVAEVRNWIEGLLLPTMTKRR